MRAIRIGLALLFTTLSCLAQGQVVFANKVTSVGLDAPVTVVGTNPSLGPGPSWSAQLYIVYPTGSLAALTPASTFRPAGVGAAAIADRYWIPQTVDVPVQPGTETTFVVRAWLTSLGSYDAAVGKYWAESAPFVVTVGGGLLPPANLTTLQAFTIMPFPEPSTITLGLVGSVMLFFFRRQSRSIGG